MVKVYIKRRINDQTTIRAGRGGGGPPVTRVFGKGIWQGSQQVTMIDLGWKGTLHYVIGRVFSELFIQNITYANDYANL